MIRELAALNFGDRVKASFLLLRPGLAGFAFLAAALGGCGFTPLLGTNHPNVQPGLESVRVETIPDRSGQILRNHLIDLLTPRGVQSSQPYALVVRLAEPRREIAIRRDDTASRLAYTATASFQLLDARRRSVFSGVAFSETTYEATNSEFATLSSHASARDRALQEVSADIRQQLATFFAGKAPPPQR